MANFFAGIAQKMKESAARGKQIIDQGQAQKTAAPRPNISTSGNFFQDIADKVLKPQEFIQQPAPIERKTAIPPDILGTIRDIAQGTARSGASVGLSLTGVSKITPEEVGTHIGPTAKKTYEFLFGKEPIKSLGTRSEEASKFLQEKLGLLEKISKPLSIIGVVGLTALDFTPVGGEKNAIKAIAKSTDEKVIAGILKKINIAEDLIPSYAKKLVGISKEEEVVKILKEIKETKNLAQEAKKYKSAEEFVKKAETESINLPVNKIGGLEPQPAPFPKTKRAITEPVEVVLTEQGDYILEAGNHRIHQAIFNGDATIPAKIRFEKGAKSQLTDFYNQSVKEIKPAKEILPGMKAINFTPEAKSAFEKVTAEVAPELEKIKGKTLTHEEVVEAAKSSGILQRVTTREATLEREATVLRTKQHLAALAEGKGITSEFIETLTRLSSEASAYGRQLEALKTPAGSELFDRKVELVNKLLDAGIEMEKIVKAAEGLDVNNAKQVQEFYRKFIKPKFGEIIDEYRYINLLSSPKTHIVNAFTNLLNAGVVNPITKLTSGVIDTFYSGITRSERLHYISEVPAYYKGVFNSTGDAVSQAFDVLRGKQTIYRPDLNRIPTGTKLLAPFQTIPRLLEAGDVFFRTLIIGGEKEALALKYSKQGTFIDGAVQSSIDQIAKSKGEYYVFRQALDPSNESGQGIILSQIDKLTSSVYKLRDVPGVKWFIPFVQTPMNILKQGLEFSPLGVTTLVGNTNKIEQVAKATVGSMVFMGAGHIAAKGDSTWALPTDKKERDYFYASGRQPYSLKIGDKWYSYSRLGHVAYPIAMASALKYYFEQNPKAATQSNLEKATRLMGGLAGFFADQSYIEGVGNFVDAARGDPEAISKALTQVPSQLIPLASLQRWVADFVDPIFRKSARGLSEEAIIQNLAKGIPGLSRFLPAYKTPLTGEEERKQFPVIRALSPIGVTASKKDFEELYQLLIRKRTLSAELNKMKEDIRKELGL